jgi:transcriptional regulator with XRE-family HTH domain
MSESSKWASFVRAHRIAQNQNQQEFAKALGVSQQTISRWESGGQTPDPSIQEQLKRQLSATALGSTAFWKHRVRESVGLEVLVDRDMVVLAMSKGAKLLLIGDQDASEGETLIAMLPKTEAVKDLNEETASLGQFQNMGFFDGLVRSVRVDAEWHLHVGSFLCKTDVWPILTSEQTIIGQFSGTPTPIGTDPSGFLGVRVKRVDVRLNKDT